MKNSILFLVFTFFAFHSEAKWVVDQVVSDIHLTEPTEIAQNLSLFPNALNSLNSINLTSDSKVIVKEFLATIINYRWENDENCKVSDPTKIEKIQLSQSLSVYILAELPDDYKGVENAIFLQSPCMSANKTNLQKFYSLNSNKKISFLLNVNEKF